MGTKSKLELAVEERAASLNEVQRELVMDRLKDYRRNRARIAKIDERLKAMDSQPCVWPEDAKVNLAHRTALIAERGKLAEANDAISSKLFDQLGG